MKIIKTLNYKGYNIRLIYKPTKRKLHLPDGIKTITENYIIQIRPEGTLRYKRDIGSKTKKRALKYLDNLDKIIIRNKAEVAAMSMFRA